MNAQKILTFMTTIGLCALMVSCTNGKASPPQEALNRLERSDLRTFNTLSVKPTDQTGTTNLNGRVIAMQKFEVTAEVQGTALQTSKIFKEGVDFRKGETLIRIDGREYENSIRAQKSQFLSALVGIMSDLQLDFPSDFEVWNDYLDQVNVHKPLPILPDVQTSQLRYYLAAKNIFNLYYGIRSAEERLRKYTIRAPFDGTVSVSSVDIGSLIRPNTKLGELLRTDKFEILASVSISDIAWVQTGQEVLFVSSDTGGEWIAKVARIGKRVDAGTQAVPVYLTVNGEGLKEGMYLEGQLAGHTHSRVVKIPKSLITRSNQVHVIEDSVVKLKKVDLVSYINGSVLVSGLSDGDLLIVDPVNSPIQGIKAVSK